MIISILYLIYYLKNIFMFLSYDFQRKHSIRCSPLPLLTARTNFPDTLVYQIPEEDILEDLRIINKIAGKPLARKPIVGATGANSSPNGGGGGGAGGSGGTSCGSYPSSQGGGGLNGGASCASTAAALSGSPVLTFGPSLAQDSRHQVESLYDAKIDDGRLQYDRKWLVRWVRGYPIGC